MRLPFTCTGFGVDSKRSIYIPSIFAIFRRRFDKVRRKDMSKIKKYATGNGDRIDKDQGKIGEDLNVFVMLSDHLTNTDDNYLNVITHK